MLCVRRRLQCLHGERSPWSSGPLCSLRRRYLWLASHPEEAPPALTAGQWFEVLLGALAATAVSGLLALAALLMLRGLNLADPYLAAPLAVAGLVGYATGLWLRASCRHHNRISAAATHTDTADPSAARSGNPAEATSSTGSRTTAAAG